MSRALLRFTIGVLEGLQMGNIVSLSGGKDSTAMTLMMLERGEDIHSVVFFDTGWEFPEMHEHINRLEQYTGMIFVRLKPKHSFEYLRAEHQFKPRQGNRSGIGYGWPSPLRRWCTRQKMETIKRYQKANPGHSACIGYALDEAKRCESKDSIGARFPLIEYKVTEAEAMQYCRDHGFDWGGLYDIFHRVSCFCCPLSGIRGMRKLRKYRPELWARILEMDKTSPSHNRGFVGYETAHDLEQRFQNEDAQMTLWKERT